MSDKSRRLTLSLPQSSMDRIEHMKAVAEWPTNTDVVRRSLRLTEVILDEFNDGAIFYIQRKDDEKPVPFQLLAI